MMRRAVDIRGQARRLRAKQLIVRWRYTNLPNILMVIIMPPTRRHPRRMQRSREPFVAIRIDNALRRGVARLLGGIELGLLALGNEDEAGEFATDVRDNVIASGGAVVRECVVEGGW